MCENEHFVIAKKHNNKAQIMNYIGKISEH